MKNYYTLINNTLHIQVVSRTYGTFTILVDKEHLTKLEDYTIGVKMRGDHKPYAYISGKGKTTILHRFLLNYNGTLQVDHINNNGLDNRLENLRIGTRSQNLQNVKMFKHNTSGVKGLSFNKRYNIWRAYIKLNGKFVWQKKFPYNMKEQAIKELEQARMKYHEWAPRKNQKEVVYQ